MLYVIQRGEDGPVKIGLTRHPRARLSQLQTGHDVDLHLRAVWDGGHVDELALHARFAASRLRGEWFALDPDVEHFVSERRACYEATRDRARPRVRHELWDEHACLERDDWRDADEWVGVLCDIAPSLSPEHILIYLRLVACADSEGRAVDINFDALSDCAFTVRDRVRVARLVVDLRRLLLPGEASPYHGSAQSRLVMTLSAASPRLAAGNGRSGAPLVDLENALVEGMAAHGSASLWLVRYGAGFGPGALPQSSPRDQVLSVRLAWAVQVVAAARDRDGAAIRANGI